MSDCSTQAMKPKEPPRTCGTCFYSTPRKYGHWTTNDLICLRHAISTNSERHHTTACGWGIAGPCGWRPKEPDAVEQRCQQLEQVAREMYDWADGVVNRCYTVVPGRVDGFRARLEALGVSLDD